MTPHNEQPPAPVGDPEAMQGLTAGDVGKLLLAGSSTLAALGAGFILTAGSVGRSAGATVSSRVQWQQRDAEIRHVIADSESRTPIVADDE